MSPSGPQAAEDGEGVLRSNLPDHLTTGLDVDARTRGRLAGEPLGEGARLVLVDGSDEDVRPAPHHLEPFGLEAVGERDRVRVGRELYPHLQLRESGRERLGRLTLLETRVLRAALLVRSR